MKGGEFVKIVIFNDNKVVDVIEAKDIKASNEELKWHNGSIKGERLLEAINYAIFEDDFQVEIDDVLDTTVVDSNKKDPNEFVEVSPVEVLEEKTTIMQEIDDFTLQLTSSVDQRTVDMQGIDDFALQMIMTLEQRMNELEARIQTLEGSNV